MHCTEQPARCSVFPGELLQHTHTDVATRWHVINIVFLQWQLSWQCAPITQPRAANVWSPQQRNSYMAHNTIDQNLSTCLCMCARARVCVYVGAIVCFLCVQACFFPPFPLVCTFGGCESESRRKMLFMKLVSFILDVMEGGGGCQRLSQLEISKHREKSCWSMSVCVVFNDFKRWVIPIKTQLPHINLWHQQIFKTVVVLVSGTSQETTFFLYQIYNNTQRSQDAQRVPCII